MRRACAAIVAPRVDEPGDLDVPPPKRVPIDLTHSQENLLAQLLLVQASCLTQLDNIVESAFVDGNIHAHDEVGTVACDCKVFVNDFIVHVTGALLDRVLALKEYREDHAHVRTRLSERKRRRGALARHGAGRLE